MTDKAYKTFMRHAKKVTRSDSIGERPVLRGVKHYDDGSLAVTDSHRLYVIKDMHDKGETIITPDGKKLEGAYPDVARLIPKDYRESITINVDEMLRAAEIMLTANSVSNSSRHNAKSAVMHWEVNVLSMFEPGVVSAEYELPQDYTLTEVEELASNSRYWVDAMKMFKAFKYKEVELNLTSGMRPFTLASSDGKLMALIMPVRSF